MSLTGSLEPAEVPARSAPAVEAYPPANSSSARSTLLCVNDEAGMLASLRSTLESRGYRTLTAASGLEGLEILHRDHVDLILSDVRLPDMDGAEFLHRARDGWPDAVRLLLTEHADIVETIAIIDRGEIFGYIAKPWIAEDLLLTVRRALERSLLEREKQCLESRTVSLQMELGRLSLAPEAKIAAQSGEPEGVNQTLAHDSGASLNDHRESVEALRQSRQLLDNIVDNIPTAVQLKSVQDGFRVAMWNKAAEAMYGLPRDLAIGRNVFDLWPQADAERMHAADCELIASGGMHEFPDRPAQTKHRGTIRAYMRKVVLCDAGGTPTHLLVIADDITARIAADTELRESEARFRSLTALSSDYYWEQDHEFRGKRRTLGSGTVNTPPLGKFYGERRWDIKNASPLKGTWADHEATQNAHLPFRDFEFKVVQEDGSVRYRSVSGEPNIDQDGRFVGYRGIGRDITEQKLAEDELRRTNAELSELNAKLSVAQTQLLQSEKLASIGQLAAGVAHEINNPIGYVFSNFSVLEKYLDQLFAMLSAYETAESAPCSAESSRKLAELRERLELRYLKEDIPALMAESKEGIARVEKIVQNLKDFSRADGPKDWHRTDLHACIDSTLNIVNNEIKYKADVVREYGAIPQLECLPSQINQVILNLLVNAAQAIGKERGRITIATGNDDAQVWFAITDTGCGMSREIQSRIFDPFFTTKPVGQGTGLGLALTYGIVREHRGHIDVDSEPGRGTTFRVTLPIDHSAETIC